jgi:cytosine/adenosine deaminase-related metal-dependent hydrolase
VAIGTDSRASNPDLSVLAELRLAAATFPEIAPPQVLELGTLAGARALGAADESGSLERGKFADLAVVALPEEPDRDPFRLLFDSGQPVLGTMFRGHWVWLDRQHQLVGSLENKHR